MVIMLQLLCNYGRATCFSCKPINELIVNVMDRTANEQVEEYQSRLQINIGTRAHLEGDYVAAIDAFHTAAKAKPKLLANPKYHLNIGVVQYDKGDLQQALLSFNKALNLKPSYAIALNNVGNVLKRMGTFLTS